MANFQNYAYMMRMYVFAVKLTEKSLLKLEPYVKWCNLNVNRDFRKLQIFASAYFTLYKQLISRGSFEKCVFNSTYLSSQCMGSNIICVNPYFIGLRACAELIYYFIIYDFAILVFFSNTIPSAKTENV